MTRIVFGQLIFFLLPFVGYACYLFARKRNPAKWDSWSAHIPKLAIAGLVCVIIAFLVTGITAPRETRVWVPAHMENGQLVPGHYRE
ncbi:DUF6111 family protein [Microvirga sp. W0021]|uniref:DUF6111 family protein n=1 Tax=Hohaiivirga grylli TaxID=3133970 RepID=A0ABV0BLL4_9HYPH